MTWPFIIEYASWTPPPQPTVRETQSCAETVSTSRENTKPFFSGRRTMGKTQNKTFSENCFYFAVEVASSWRIGEISFEKMGLLLFFVGELGALSWWGDDGLHYTWWTSSNQDIYEWRTHMPLFKGLCLMYYFLFPCHTLTTFSPNLKNVFFLCFNLVNFPFHAGSNLGLIWVFFSYNTQP